MKLNGNRKQPSVLSFLQFVTPMLGERTTKILVGHVGRCESDFYVMWEVDGGFLYTWFTMAFRLSR